MHLLLEVVGFATLVEGLPLQHKSYSAPSHTHAGKIFLSALLNLSCSCLAPADKHEPDHKPQFHKGLVLKHNVNQRYATNAISATLFKHAPLLVPAVIRFVLDLL